jgi:YD repeat-containing protein
MTRANIIGATMIAIVLALFLPTAALAQSQSRTIYDSSGRVSGRTSTDSQGSTTFYDASGRVSGRSSTDSQGTTTFYDAAGRRTGTVTTTKKSK